MGEELDVGMKCIKYMLFVTNFMFVMIGFLLISIGSTIHSIYSDFDVFMQSHYFSPSALVVAIGIIIFLVSLFGCVGAIKESTCLVNLYALMLALVLILEISAAIAAFSMNGNVRNAVGKQMVKAVNAYYEKPPCGKDAMDFLQQRLQCCGVNNYTDWADIIHEDDGFLVNNETMIRVPDSCCYKSKYDDDHSDESNEHSHEHYAENDTCRLFKYSCLGRLTYVIKECAVMLGTGAICVAFVQLLGVIFANMLARNIRRVKSEEARKKWERRQSLYEQLARQQNLTPVKQVIYGNTGSTDA